MRFKKYKRTQVAEMRPVEKLDVAFFGMHGCIVAHSTTDNVIKVSISQPDLQNGSPKIGDMIARNPKNHLDQWLVAEQYFKDNFKELQQLKQIKMSDYTEGQALTDNTINELKEELELYKRWYYEEVQKVKRLNYFILNIKEQIGLFKP